MPSWEEISVFMITHNAEELLEYVLAQIPEEAEIIVIDNMSTDRTRDIARSFGAHVEERPFDGFVRQKEYALSLTSRPWVFNLDADEILSDALVEEIAQEDTNPNISAYAIPFKTYFLGKWVKHCGWWPDYKTRLVRRDVAIIQSAGQFVHERLAPRSGQIKRLHHPIHHISYRTLDDMYRKNWTYALLSARDLFLKGEKTTVLKQFLLPAWSFFHTYILRKGFLDGVTGLWIAYLHARTVWWKYLKLWELNNNTTTKDL